MNTATVPAAEPARLERDEDVLAAVVSLSARYRAPSTTLITWHLAGDRRVGAAFQAAVREALERLLASGRVACVAHRGIRHWSAVRGDG